MLSFIGALLFFSLVALAICLVANWSDRPDRNRRHPEDVKKIRKLHNSQADLILLMNTLDADARAEYAVTQSNFAWSVSNRIENMRREMYEV